MTPRTSNKTCIICGLTVVNSLKINTSAWEKSLGSLRSSWEITSSTSRWEILSMECLCLLFGLPVNHKLTSYSFGGEENGGVGGNRQLCNQCLEDTSNVQFVFWQLHNLEGKLEELQEVIYGRLRNCWADRKKFKKTEGICDEIMGSFLSDVQTGRDSWPRTVYSSRWKEAQHHSQILLELHPANVLNNDYASVKVEVDPELVDTENMEEVEKEVPEFQDDNENGDDDDDFEANEESDDDSDWEDDLDIKNSSRRKASKKQGAKGTRSSSLRFLCTADPSICNKAFATNKYLQKHIRRFHIGRVHACDVEGCQEKFLHERTLVMHKNRYHDGPSEERPFLCQEDPSICTRTYTSQNQLNKHIRRFHIGRVHICDFPGCPEKFLHERTLSSHKARDHGTDPEKKFRCTEDPAICTRSYPYQGDLQKHIKEFHQGRDHICTEPGCPEKFRNAKNLLQHQIKAHGFAKPATKTCTLCNLTLSLKAFRKHKLRHHQGQDQKHKCSLCHLEFSDPAEFEEHGRLHSEVASTFPFTCVVPSCLQVLTNSLELKSHVANNHMPGWLKCDQCGVAKANQGLLDRHMKIHEAKTLACDQCPQMFSTAKGLASHKKNWHDGSLNVCEVCGKEFTVWRQFMRHRWSHREQKKYKCTICDKTFSFGHSLRKHEMIHSGVMQFECELCGKRFKQSQNLRQHLKSQLHGGPGSNKMKRKRKEEKEREARGAVKVEGEESFVSL